MPSRSSTRTTARPVSGAIVSATHVTKRATRTRTRVGLRDSLAGHCIPVAHGSRAAGDCTSWTGRAVPGRMDPVSSSQRRAHMKAKQVARGVYQVGLRGVNVFLIVAGDDLVLVDAGLRSSPARITEAVYGLGRLPQNVRAIVATHAHPDHVGGLAEMQRRTGAEIWMHPAAAALVRRGVLGRPLEAGPSRLSRTLVSALGRWSSRHGEAVVVG